MRAPDPESETASQLMALQPGQTGNRNLLTTPHDRQVEIELSDDLEFLRIALGGQWVRGSSNLLAGYPGGGKSRLATQICLGLGRQGIRTLMILTEEGPGRAKTRAVQMTSDWDPLDAGRAMSNMLIESDLLDVVQLPELLMRKVLNPSGEFHGTQLIVLDSVQGAGLASAATRTYRRVLEFAQLAEQNGITTLLLSHVTKGGEMAGPRALEHGVSACLVLRRAMQHSLLTVRKNRYGAPPAKPIALKIDPVTTRVCAAPHADPRPATARTYAGTGTGVVEIQASVSAPLDGGRGRMTVPGLPRREIEQLIGCISSIESLDFAELDYRIQARLPGSVGNQYQPVFGLALAMALISSYVRLPIPSTHIYLGEVDLFRSLRPVLSGRITSLRNALNEEAIPTPVRLFASENVSQQIENSNAVEVVTCESLDEAVLQTWPALR